MKKILLLGTMLFSLSFANANLNFMYQEEKLAHDVYTTLYQKWKLPIFRNIANSETRHMNAVKYLLSKYNNTDGGTVDMNEIKALYNNLVSKGNISLKDALIVGQEIEKMDIKDLTERINSTDNYEIKRILSRLRKASYNHLKAFTYTLQRMNSNNRRIYFHRFSK